MIMMRRKYALCGRVSSFRTGFIRRTAAVLNLKVAVDFEACQASTRACLEGSLRHPRHSS